MAYQAGTAFIKVTPSFAGFHEKVRAETKGIGPIVIGVDADLTGLRTKLDAATRKRTAAVGVALDDAEAKGKLDALGRDRKATVNANADTAAATAKLTALEGLVKRLDGKTISIKASVTTLGAVGSLPALGVGAGALGGLAALGGAAVAGVATAAVIGTASIKQALGLQKQLTQADKNRVTALAGVKSAEHSVASAVASASAAQVAAARGVHDAEQAVGDARRNQVRVAEQAARAITAAEENVTEAEYSVKQALDAVHQARLQAAADIADLQHKQGADARTVEGAQIALIEAQQRLVQVQKTATAGSLEDRKAKLDVANATADLADAQKQQKDDQLALTQAQKAGVDGAKGVVSATHDLAEAQKQAKDAQTALKDAQVDGARARADAARSVARAETQLARARSDGARSVAQAQAQVADAQRRLALAQDKATKADSARLKILAQMGPMQDKIIAGVKALSLAWDKLIFSKPVTGAALGGIDAAKGALPGLSNLVKPVAKATGSALTDAGQALASPGAKQFATVAGGFTGKVITDAEKGSKSLAVALGNLFKAFMPMALGMSHWLVVLMGHFADWSKTLDTNKGFQGFLAYTRKEGPVVVQFFGDLFKVAGKLLKAVAPLGAVLFTVISDIVGFLAKLSPGQLLAIAGAIVAIFVAFKVARLVLAIREASGAFAVLNAVMDANPIGLVILAVAALTAGFIYAYKHSETFRKIIDGVFSFLKDAVTATIGFVTDHWKLIVSVIGGPLVAAVILVTSHWGEIQDAFVAVKNWVINTWSAAWAVVKSYITFPIRAGRDFIAAIFGKGGAVRSAFTAIKDWVINTWTAGWSALQSVITAPIRGARDVFIALLGKGGTIRTTFSNAVAAIGSIWDGLRELAAKPINFIIDTVYNHGLAPALRLLPGINKKNLPDAQPIKFAGGGVLPGYTPGRDVHTFLSPTGGVLHLSGGEAIMRPEWTRSVGGPQAVARMNTAAISGQQASFAGGGVLGKAMSYLNPAKWVEGLYKIGGYGPLLTDVTASLFDSMADYIEKHAKSLISISPAGALYNAVTGGSTGGVVMRHGGYAGGGVWNPGAAPAGTGLSFAAGAQSSLVSNQELTRVQNTSANWQVGDRSQRPINVYDRSGDPVQTAHETARLMAWG